MAKPLNLDELDSASLYRLAQEKERAEQERRKLEQDARLEELRALRRETVARHKKELAEIDRKIGQELPRRTVVARGPGKTRRRGDGPTITDLLISAIGEKKSMHVEEIRERAVAHGLKLSTVTQMLAYLKRTGRLKSPRRGEYSVAA